MLDAAHRLDWTQQITAAVAGQGGTLTDATRALRGWLDAETSGEGGLLVDLLYESAARAWMAGQLMVRDHEMPAPAVALAVEGPGPDFLSLPFELALRRFLEREILSPDEAFDALGRLRERSFSARKLAAEAVVREARDAIARSLEDGESVDDFIESVLSEERSLGISPSSHGYLRTVFETNVVSAYSAGRDEQLTQPDVIEALPFRVYRAVVDGRTRASHAALDGKAWDARTTDEWRRFQGPNGFNCRCQVVSAFESNPAALRRPASHPDPAFDQAPTLAL